MGNYELVVIYHPDLEIDLDKALAKINGIIADCGGKVLFVDDWGKRKLAYNIAKQSYGLYYYYELEIGLDKVKKLEGLLNITGEIIRYLITKPTPNFGDRSKSPLIPDSEAISDNEAEEPKRDKDKSTKAPDEEE